MTIKTNRRFHPLSRIGAMAITAAVMLSGCSSDEIEGTGVKKEDVGKGVATQFALNIGRATSDNFTRQTSYITQSNLTFRGMDNIILIPMNFRQATEGDLTSGLGAYAGPNQTFANTKVYGSSWDTTIYPLGGIGSSEINGSNSSKVYTLTLPVGTSNFLFYGKAPRQSMSTLDEENAVNGCLALNVGTEITKADEIYSELVQITDAYSAPEAVLIEILNGIAATPGWRSVDPVVVKMVQLHNAYTALTGIYDGEVRGGSAEAIRATVQSVYRIVLGESRSDDAEVKALALNIRHKIEESFDIFFDQVADDMNVYDTPVDPAKIDEDTNNDGVYDHQSGAAYLQYKSIYSAIVTNFPRSLGLPEGAAYLTFSSTTGKFSYVNNSSGLVSGETQDLNNLVYPAELTYFANSGLFATPAGMEVSDYPSTVNTWDTPATWSAWTQSAVSATTRSVAMKDNVNYGVAMLKSTLNLGAATVSNSLDDNRAAIIADGVTQDQTIPINPNSFILTGIIISGQPNRVDWQFLPTNDGYEKLVYDRFIDNGTASGATSHFDAVEYPVESYDKSTSKNYYYVPSTAAEAKANYTLLLDNYKADALPKVKVVLELINNTGMEFYGRKNIIPAGGTFYLIGELDPDDTVADSSIDWATYTARGNTDYIQRFPAYMQPRVFVQDHTTVANFSLSYNALKNAYNTIPDLRTVQMVFGLSVDLQWLRGLEFNVPI